MKMEMKAGDEPCFFFTLPEQEMIFQVFDFLDFHSTLKLVRTCHDLMFVTEMNWPLSTKQRPSFLARMPDPQEDKSSIPNSRMLIFKNKTYRMTPDMAFEYVKSKGTGMSDTERISHSIARRIQRYPTSSVVLGAHASSLVMRKNFHRIDNFKHITTLHMFANEVELLRGLPDVEKLILEVRRTDLTQPSQSTITRRRIVFFDGISNLQDLHIRLTMGVTCHLEIKGLMNTHPNITVSSPEGPVVLTTVPATSVGIARDPIPPSVHGHHTSVVVGRDAAETARMKVDYISLAQHLGEKIMCLETTHPELRMARFIMSHLPFGAHDWNLLMDFGGMPDEWKLDHKCKKKELYRCPRMESTQIDRSSTVRITRGDGMSLKLAVYRLVDTYLFRVSRSRAMTHAFASMGVTVATSDMYTVMSQHVRHEGGRIAMEALYRSKPVALSYIQQSPNYEQDNWKRVASKCWSLFAEPISSSSTRRKSRHAMNGDDDDYFDEDGDVYHY